MVTCKRKRVRVHVRYFTLVKDLKELGDLPRLLYLNMTLETGPLISVLGYKVIIKFLITIMYLTEYIILGCQ